MYLCFTVDFRGIFCFVVMASLSHQSIYHLKHLEVIPTAIQLS